MTYAFLAFIAFIAFLGAAAAAFAAFFILLSTGERSKPQGMQMSLKTSFLEHQRVNKNTTYLQQCTQVALRLGPKLWHLLPKPPPAAPPPRNVNVTLQGDRQTYGILEKKIIACPKQIHMAPFGMRICQNGLLICILRS